VLSANSAIQGGAYFGLNASLTAINCTLVGNQASWDGGGIYILGGDVLTLTNSILWGNSDAWGTGELSQIFNYGGWGANPPVINFTDVQGWTGTLGGVGNFGADPLFVDADGADNIPGTEDDDLRLAASSPCIDAGDNEGVPGEITTDLLGNPRFIDAPDTADTGNGAAPIVDMGAFEFLPGGVVPLHLDIMPGRCPNRLNVRSNRLVSVAILGEDWFDITLIDAESVVLSRADGVGGTVAPCGRGPKFGVSIRDAATPYDGEECGCHRRRGDGLDDLILSFSAREIAGELEFDTLRRGDDVALVISGNLVNGTPFWASDCVRIIGRP